MLGSFVNKIILQVLFLPQNNTSAYSLMSYASPSPLLSFCIPSYNRVERVKALVCNLLSLPDSDIQVVVLDNGSTDKTSEVLAKIDDSRFIFASNQENQGALFNMVNVFRYATGQYVIYSTDQDSTDISKIHTFKSFLRDFPNISCGFCEFEPHADGNHKIYECGFSAVAAIAYKGRHPTGYFFRNDDLCKVRLHERFSDRNFVDLFPLEFAFAEVAMLGDGLIYSDSLFVPNNTSDVVTHRSSTTNGSSKSAFFAPAARRKLALSYSQHIHTLNLEKIEQYRLLSQVFVQELIASTLGYRSIMANHRLCIHYRMHPRAITPLDIVLISILFTSVFLGGLLSTNGLSSFQSVLVVAAFIIKRPLNKLSARQRKP